MSEFPLVPLPTPKSSHPTWRPLVPGWRADVVWEAVNAIRNDILSQREHLKGLDPTVIGGAAGVALFLAYYGVIADDEVALEASVSVIEQAVAQARAHPLSYGLFFGVAGVAWVAEHLHRHLGVLEEWFIESAFDEELESTVRAWNPEDPFELFTGLTGLEVYALERISGGKPSALANLIVCALSACSECDAHGRFWRTHAAIAAVPGVSSQRYVNLGMPHGQPGVIALLSRTHASLPTGPDQTTSAALLQEAVAWLLAQELDISTGPRFGMSVGLGPHPRALPLGWCYGDLAVACALAAVTTGTAAPKASGCVRRLISRCAVAAGPAPIDATLCHGAAGTAHLFARLYNATGDLSAAQAGRNWYDRTLRMRTRGGIGGFWGYRRKAWRADLGFLRGASGIGLALLGAVSEVAPEWDRLLLMPSGCTTGQGV